MSYSDACDVIPPAGSQRAGCDPGWESSAWSVGQ